ncbi:hypothetical protein ACFO0U_01135 [Chromohalobacter sarecensis]|uniref:Uncharacterized protein n=1 Tax=Chromohalobacter sarecensis TaxID=245294 RepID=A0ABV9CY64_9GAMM|nr:hypothetical protein [Chromohalobacter sarecensis]MCK0716463.1 hypothetical protein [Chromohalobacter sarecensis]
MNINKMRSEKLFREQDDAVRVGIKVKYICMSNQCSHHEHLHGEIIEFEQALEIFSIKNVPPGCRCACTQIVVNDSGEPVSTNLVEKIKNQKK